MPHAEDYETKEYQIGIDVTEERSNTMLVKVLAHNEGQAKERAMAAAEKAINEEYNPSILISDASDWEHDSMHIEGISSESYPVGTYSEDIDDTDNDPGPWVDPRQMDLV